MRALTTNMNAGELRPYFLWDEDVSIDELRAVLGGPEGPRRDQLLAKMLREARDSDVWEFVRPTEVAAAIERLGRRIGRRTAFWKCERGYVLTGGAALAGSHLGHRATHDLDLFTRDDDAFERGRFVLAGPDEGLVVDLVRDVSPPTGAAATRAAS